MLAQSGQIAPKKKKKNPFLFNVLNLDVIWTQYLPKISHIVALKYFSALNISHFVIETNYSSYNSRDSLWPNSYQLQPMPLFELTD